MGVTQGSILGPLIFALFIKDLSVVVKYLLLDLYADDAEMHCSHSDLSVLEARLLGRCDSVAVQFLAMFECCQIYFNAYRKPSENCK